MHDLTPRLQSIAALVPSGSVVADVGCDHAYLAIALVESGLCPRCIATDVRPGPLARAERNVSAAGLADRISLRLGDGLSPLHPAEADTVILAGMGGDTMEAILRASPWVEDGAHTLILQPQSHGETLRAYLNARGFAPEEERISTERSHVYVAFRARHTGEVSSDPLLPYASPALLSLPREVRAPYKAKLLARLEKSRAGLARSAQGQAEAEAIGQLILQLREVL